MLFKNIKSKVSSVRKVSCCMDDSSLEEVAKKRKP
jgi:hypothetical protein